MRQEATPSPAHDVPSACARSRTPPSRLTAPCLSTVRRDIARTHKPRLLFSTRWGRGGVKRACAAAVLAAACAAAAHSAERRPAYRVLSVRMPEPITYVGALTCPGLAPDRLVRWPQPPGAPDPGSEAPPVQVVMVADGQNHRSRIRLEGGALVVEPLGDCRPPVRVERPGLVDGGRVETGTGYIAQAWLAVPTLKYRHGTLSNVITAAELRVTNRQGDTLRYPLPDDAVFEDRWARTVFVDGQDAVLVVRSGLKDGAALALFGLDRQAADASGLVLLARSASLGAPNLWLNPIGVGDFDGSGRSQIAAVLNPDAGGVLAIYQREGVKLVERYREPGFSNHEMYSDELGMAALLDANGDGITDLAVPDAKRRALRVVTFADGRFAELQRIPHDSPIVSAIVAQALGPGGPSLVYALEDGTVVVVTK